MGEGYYASTAASTDTTATWIAWVDNGTSSTYTTSATWIHWVVTDCTQATVINANNWVAPSDTPEQRAAWERERREVAARAEVAAAARRAELERARSRARELLASMLDVRQREQLQRERFFEVVAQSQRRYRIREGWAGNIDEIDAHGRAVARYCIHPTCDVPIEDNMLAQKLLLEADERAFHAIANRTELRVASVQ